MSRQLHHISITCTNLNKSVDFYVKLGFKIEKYYDDENIKIRWLISGNTRLEFFYFYKNEKPLVKKICQPYHFLYLLKRHGITHIALQTDNVKKLHQNITVSGITCSEITQARIGDYLYFFVTDPDENLIEFIGNTKC